MRRLFFSLSLFIVSLVPILPATGALAFSPLGGACTGSASSESSVCADQSGSNTFYGPNSLVDKVINLFSIFAGIVAVFAIVVAGFMFVTSGGDSGKVSTAKNTILYVVVGLVVVAAAQILENFVLNNIHT